MASGSDASDLLLTQHGDVIESTPVERRADELRHGPASRSRNSKKVSAARDPHAASYN
jgi:hypothetical protein